MGHPWARVEKGQPPRLRCRKPFAISGTSSSTWFDSMKCAACASVARIRSVCPVARMPWTAKAVSQSSEELYPCILRPSGARHR